MLRLKLRLVASARELEIVGIANSGFIGREPEVAFPKRVAEELGVLAKEPVYEERVLADGTTVRLPTYHDAVEVYVVAGDREVGPVRASAVVSGGKYVLLNDKLLGELGVVCLDFADGLWCFRDEVGRKVRASA